MFIPRQETIGQRVKSVREWRHFTRRELAIASKMQDSTIWRVETDEGSPQESTLKKIGDVLGVRPPFLRGYEDDGFAFEVALTRQALRIALDRNLISPERAMLLWIIADAGGGPPSPEAWVRLARVLEPPSQHIRVAEPRFQ